MFNLPIEEAGGVVNDDGTVEMPDTETAQSKLIKDLVENETNGETISKTWAINC